MGIFDKSFGKKKEQEPSESKTTVLQAGDQFISTGDDHAFRVVRPLTEAQRWAVYESTILLRTGQLYMHYWTDNLDGSDRNDPRWQNIVLYFWKAEEPFPKKALPPEFETFGNKFFLFSGDTSRINLQVGKAIPWFCMPGEGEKHACRINGELVTVPELYQMGLVEYVEMVELTEDNGDILTNREEYMFLIDERITPFRNGNFYLKAKPVSIDLTYSIGGIHIIKKAGLT